MLSASRYYQLIKALNINIEKYRYGEKNIIKNINIKKYINICKYKYKKILPNSVVMPKNELLEFPGITK